MPDVVDAAKDADILVFVIPHQFIGRLCDTLKDSVKKDAIGISLIKVGESGIDLYSLPRSGSRGLIRNPH